MLVNSAKGLGKNCVIACPHSNFQMHKHLTAQANYKCFYNVSVHKLSFTSTV